EKLELDMIRFTVYPGDTLLLCSDGLYQSLLPDTLGAALNLPSPSLALQRLFNQCLAGPARENRSAVVTRSWNMDIQMTTSEKKPQATKTTRLAAAAKQAPTLQKTADACVNARTQVLCKRCRFERLLGVRGMGPVYRAKDLMSAHFGKT